MDDVLSCLEPHVGNPGSQGWLVLLKCDFLQGPSLSDGRGPGRRVGDFLEQGANKGHIPALCQSSCSCVTVRAPRAL